VKIKKNRKEIVKKVYHNKNINNKIKIIIIHNKLYKIINKENLKVLKILILNPIK
jgi:hypothetical protein